MGNRMKASKKATEVVNVHMTKDLMAKLKKDADANALNMSAYIRTLISTGKSK